MNDTPAVELRGITKRFGAALANHDVSLTVQAGEIHALLGENGAGKSTLMRILFGFYRADRGEIRLRGERVRISGPHDAIARGIGMVHQHFMLLEPFTVWENVVLGSEPTHAGKMDRQKARAEVRELIDRFHLPLDPDRSVEDLSVGMQQQVEILKVLYRNADILIMDEPTAVLTPQEATALFEVLRGLKREGKTIIIISHKLAEVLALTDRVTVLRDGRNVGEAVTRETTREALAHMIVGREVSFRSNRVTSKMGETVLHVENLTVRGDRGESALDRLSLDVREGEIVGVAGVMGNGQSELAEALTGLRKVGEGKVELLGRSIAGLTVREIRDLGFSFMPERQIVCHVPEDRQRMGLILPWSVEENLLLGQHDLARFRVGPFLRKKAIAEHARQLVDNYEVNPADPRISVRALSGGNQQKVVLARELDPIPKFVVISQPTRGVDIGAVEFIHWKILELKTQGTAVLLISAELEEILDLADRILVLHKGRSMGWLRPEEATEEALGLMMMGQARSG